MAGMGFLGCMGLRFCFSRLGDGVRLPFVGVADGGGVGVSVGMGFRGWRKSFSGGKNLRFRIIGLALVGRSAGYVTLARRGDAPTLTLPLRGRGFFCFGCVFGLGEDGGD